MKKKVLVLVGIFLSILVIIAIVYKVKSLNLSEEQIGLSPLYSTVQSGLLDEGRNSFRIEEAKKMQGVFEQYRSFFNLDTYPISKNFQVLGQDGATCIDDGGYFSDKCEGTLFASLGQYNFYKYRYISVDGNSYILEIPLESRGSESSDRLYATPDGIFDTMQEASK